MTVQHLMQLLDKADPDESVCLKIDGRYYRLDRVIVEKHKALDPDIERVASGETLTTVVESVMWRVVIEGSTNDDPEPQVLDRGD